jgi:Carboxypeptidase regulatory-like domain/Putative zinc-finger
VNWNFQPGIHPDADQLSVFVEGATTTREQERMLAHLAECAECRKAVFLMPPREETQAATATPVKGWMWRRLLPVGLPAAALACALIAALIYIRPRGGAPETRQQNARLSQPEIQTPRTTVAPSINAESAARSGNPTNAVAGNTASSNLSPQERQDLADSLNLSKSKSRQTAANVESPQTMAAAPSVSGQVADEAMAPRSVTPGVKSELPLNGRNATDLQQLSAAQHAQATASQNSLAEKKDLPPLGVERASGRDATLAGVSGHITDRSGAVVAGATVTLRDASGKTRQTMTGTDGSFHLTELPAGHYELTATANGFEAKKQSIELKPSELAVLQPVLDVGRVSEAVTVEAESAAIQAQTASTNLGGQNVAEASSAGRVIALPSGLPVVTTVSHGKRFLSLDSAGNLFLSRDRGKKWKKINPQWAGKAVRIELTPLASAGAAFEMTTDAGAVWTSKDGAHWHQ